MNIALDYDGTFAALPIAWKQVVEILRGHGASVFCITSRFPNVPIDGFPGDVFYTCGQQKWEWAYEHGIKVDIWIDDMPNCIGEHPEFRGREPGQAPQRREIVKNIFSQIDWKR
jgi:hypothetical protein